MISVHFYGNSSYVASMAMCYKGDKISTAVCSSGAVVSFCVFMFSHF